MAKSKRLSGAGSRGARLCQMERAVKAQERSGLSQREFCERRGIPLSTLTWWRRKLAVSAGRGTVPAEASEESAFIRVEVVDDQPAAGTAPVGAPPIEVCLPDGTVIRIPHGVSERTLRHLITAVRLPC